MNEKAQAIVNALKEWYCPEALKNAEGIDEYTAKVYNEAMNDVINFIDVMIENNPHHTLVLNSLKHTMFPGMKLGEETE